MKVGSPALQADSLPTELSGKPSVECYSVLKKKNNVEKSERNETPRLCIPKYVKFFSRQK